MPTVDADVMHYRDTFDWNWLIAVFKNFSSLWGIFRCEFWGSGA
jgi:hypothetical protein